MAGGRALSKGSRPGSDHAEPRPKAGAGKALGMPPAVGTADALDAHPTVQGTEGHSAGAALSQMLEGGPANY